MKMTLEKREMHSLSDDPFLEEMFATARAVPEPVPEALVARVLADAAALQPRAVSAPQVRRRPLSGFFSALFGPGAWGGQLAGLALAAAAGVWIGFVQPTGPGVAGDLDAELMESLEHLPASLSLWAEELGFDEGEGAGQ